MLLQGLFWLFAAADVFAVGFLFVSGLAVGPSKKGTPLPAVVALLVAPMGFLAVAVWMFVTTGNPALRGIAVAGVAAPVVLWVTSATMAAAGTRLRRRRTDGSSDLVAALRALPADASQLAVVRKLIADGADVHRPAAALPLVLAIRATAAVGIEPVELLLAAGADPDANDASGVPAWFAALGPTIDPAVLRLLLLHGADVGRVDPSGRSGARIAADAENWSGLLLVLQQGVAADAPSPLDPGLRELLEGRARQRGEVRGLREVLAFVRSGH
jgi:hypothetical protein